MLESLVSLRPVAVLGLIGGLAIAAAAQAPTEYQVKAAFLYNFSRFVQWPSEARGHETEFVVTVLGKDPFGRVLEEALRGKTVDDKPIVIRRVSRASEMGPSQLLFVAASESDHLRAILEQVGAQPVLTVSDADGFAERGGIIGFKLEEQRVRLQVNLTAAERAQLRISSQLLRLAEIVRPNQGR